MKKYLIGASAAALLALTACGTGDTSAGDSNQNTPPTAAGEAQQSSHNDSDIAFAQQMIPHHEQAGEMADLALERSTNPNVKSLAERTTGAQDPEIQQMTGLLKKWGVSAARDKSDMTGMMSGEEMRQLEQATGSEFDVMWLQMMVQHHQDAIEMAKTELEEGSDADAKALAQRIIETQEAEIREMVGFLPH
ncbi:DUF305 domain-containing protein [Saccharomonospora cyanea]|uniref:DUF305 domain-containing protein n=1 Tax=Saccharomonospora cyanea NA-134 TaxID=882082 RepID=H5XDM2_9PSEU|nr:DUF305 domain-containing protein [Saccharomonospora cyanea]EHR61343.1 hypothetical protein SaccyDRAFT_2472 [Saccharomonospora cyanea NA-134]